VDSQDSIAYWMLGRVIAVLFALVVRKHQYSLIVIMRVSTG